MMNASRWSGAAVAGLFVLSLLWLVSARSVEGADLVRGERLYRMLCVKCHGKEGRGDGPQAKELEKLPADYTEPGFFDRYSDADLKQAVIAGAPPMPAFGERLKASDVDDVIAYIKTFATRARK